MKNHVEDILMLVASPISPSVPLGRGLLTFLIYNLESRSHCADAGTRYDLGCLAAEELLLTEFSLIISHRILYEH